MKLLLTTLIAVLIGVGIWYFVSSKQAGMQMHINSAQTEAQQKADAYQKQQQDMMKQLGQ